MPKKQTRAHTKTQTTIIQCKQQRITTTIITLPFENEPDSLLNEREVAPKKDMQERSWNTHSLKHSNSMCTVDIDWGQPLHTKAHTHTPSPPRAHIRSFVYLSYRAAYMSWLGHSRSFSLCCFVSKTNNNWNMHETSAKNCACMHNS